MRSWYTGFSSEIGTKLRDWAVGQAWGSCYSWAALSSNDSKTLYVSISNLGFVKIFVRILKRRIELSPWPGASGRGGGGRPRAGAA